MRKTTNSAHESGEAGPAGLQAYLDFCVEHIRTIVRDIGPRPPASAEELRAQRYLAELLRSSAEAVELEAFRVSPKAFMGFIPVTGALLLAGVGLYHWAPLLALVCVAGAVALLVGELVLYRQLIDPLFARATSHNLVATIPPRGSTERILLFGGHCDSAYEWRWHYLGQTAFRIIVGGAAAGAGVALIATSVNWIAPDSGLSAFLGWTLAAFAPFFLLIMGFSNFRRVSPGANDNLTGVLLSVAIAKYLHDQGQALDHTEIRILNTGSEEAGLRGASAYAARHRDELTSTPSLYVALDTFRDLEHMAIYDRDRNGTLRHDPGAARLLQGAARRAGFDLPFRAVPLGASDAAGFTRAGLRAIALIAMDPAPPRWYHTRLDEPDLLNPACIEAGLRVMLELIRTVDAEGLGSGS